MTFIDQPSRIPEVYDLFFSKQGTVLPSELIVSRRQMANQTLGFSSTVFRKKFRSAMTAQSYRDNEIIFSQGDQADAIFYIQSGTVKLTMAATRRKKAIIAVMPRGSFFGEGCLGGQSLRMYTARSIGPANITRLRRRARFAHSSATRSLRRC
jgi:CRP-like cAMP-binding protein